jgi:hypothetical protein
VTGKLTQHKMQQTSKAPVCAHGLAAYLIEVHKDGPNKGRKFYCCPMQKTNKCDFFAWADGAPAAQPVQGVPSLAPQQQTFTFVGTNGQQVMPHDAQAVQRQDATKWGLQYQQDANGHLGLAGVQDGLAYLTEDLRRLVEFKLRAVRDIENDMVQRIDARLDQIRQLVAAQYTKNQ